MSKFFHSLTEFFQYVDEQSSTTKESKASLIRTHADKGVKEFLRSVYDPTLEFLLPYTDLEVDPQYKPLIGRDPTSPTSRKLQEVLPHLVAMRGDPRKIYGRAISDKKRDKIFLDFLETIPQTDAELVLKAVRKQPVEGLDMRSIKSAFPDMVTKEKDWRTYLEKLGIPKTEQPPYKT